MAPSCSRAVSTMVFVPSRSVTGAVTTTDGCGLASVWRCTSVPLSVTVTLPTPRPDETTAATTVCSSVTRTASAGWRTVIVSGVALSKWIVRTSWRMAPSASVAATTSRLAPSRSLSTRLSETAGRGGRSSVALTSPPFSVTTTRATPRPLVTRPASGIASRSTRAWSAGFDTFTASAAGGVAGAAGAGLAGAVTSGFGAWRGGACGGAGTGAGGVGAGGWAATAGAPASSNVSNGLPEAALTIRCSEGAYQTV